MRVLVVNAGSSSLKSQLLETDGKISLMKCLAEKVGTPDAYMNVSFAPDFRKTKYQMPGLSVDQCLAKLLDILVEDPESPISALDQIDAVGNRIVAGLADATVLVESAAKGGGLITAAIARSYNRDVLAFPGAVGAPYSEGCNRLIRDNGAALITSASDLVDALGWRDEALACRARREGIERQLFPELSADERLVTDLLANTNDLQLNIIAVRTGLPVARLTALLFSLEMKGVVRPLAGGTYHLMS